MQCFANNRRGKSEVVAENAEETTLISALSSLEANSGSKLFSRGLTRIDADKKELGLLCSIDEIRVYPRLIRFGC
jgi:hypothetical protein